MPSRLRDTAFLVTTVPIAPLDTEIPKALSTTVFCVTRIPMALSATIPESNPVTVPLRMVTAVSAPPQSTLMPVPEPGTPVSR